MSAFRDALAAMKGLRFEVISTGSELTITSYPVIGSGRGQKALTR
jgi:hypothetical protein